MSNVPCITSVDKKNVVNESESEANEFDSVDSGLQSDDEVSEDKQDENMVLSTDEVNSSYYSFSQLL